jgi:hypothetical protein
MNDLWKSGERAEEKKTTVQTIAHVGMLRVVLDISVYDHTTLPIGAWPDGVITVVPVHTMSPIVTITGVLACAASMGTPQEDCGPGCPGCPDG